MNNFNNILTTALKQNNLSLSDQIQQKLIRYLELMQQWNKVFNLTSITEPRDMVYLHIVDSLIVSPYLHGKHMLDVGSGAGLPGIPLAILSPDQQWTLLDKNNKKTRFMIQAIAELGLNNVKVIHSRCEDFHPAQCFDSILSRAYGTLTMFADGTAHLLCTDGLFIAMKGKYPQEELDTLSNNYRVENVVRLNLQGLDVERHIVCLRESKR